MTNTSGQLTERAVLQDYNSLLDRLDDTTDQLLAAICSWDTGEVQRLVEIRGRLCSEMSLRLAEMNDLINRAASGDSSGRDELREAVAHVQTKHEHLLKKQAECAAALSAGLDKCKSDLINLNQRRDLRSVYRSPRTAGHARFLDNKL